MILKSKHNKPNNTDLLKKIIRPPPLCRPAISQGSASPEFIQLMKECWSELPEARPEFENILTKLKAINKGRSSKYTIFEMKCSNSFKSLLYTLNYLPEK